MIKNRTSKDARSFLFILVTKEMGWYYYKRIPPSSLRDATSL